MELFPASDDSQWELIKRVIEESDYYIVVVAAEARIRPRTGWVRADQARSEEDLHRERKLSDELDAARNLIGELEREIRDRAILGDELPEEMLAQGEDICELAVTFQDQEKRLVYENISLT